MEHPVTIRANHGRLPSLAARVMLFFLVVVVVGGALLLYLRARDTAAGPYQPPRVPVNPAIEERFGVRFTFLAVTANGGLIDLRYRIVDAGKAKNFGHYTETSPMLIAEDTGAIIDVTRMGLHNHRVQPGLVFGVLFRNTGNAIQRGRPVTIQVGDLQIKHVIVQ